MQKRFIYLAGPIAGCDKGQANDWREYVKFRLPKGIVGVSPLRCEPIVGDRYELGYDDDKFGTSRAISSKNELDTRTCDMVLAYLPRALNEQRPSWGTALEIGWAHALNKPVILVTDDPYLKEHPVMSACASWLLPSLDDSIEVIKGVMEVYAQ